MILSISWNGEMITITKSVKKRFKIYEDEILYFEITCMKFESVDPINGDIGRLRNFFIDYTLNLKCIISPSSTI